MQFKEWPNKFLFRFEVPDAKREDVEVYVDERSLKVLAKVSEEVRVPLTPRRYVDYISLREPVVPEKATAKYENGILMVRLPKRVVERKLPIE